MTEGDSQGDSGSGSGASTGNILPQVPRRRWVALILLGVLVLSLVGVVQVAGTPDQTAASWTEFYIEGNASDYPTNLTVGETGELEVGVTNYAHHTTEYRVVARLGDRTVLNRSVSVAKSGTWVGRVAFTPSETGRHRLQLSLYEDGELSGEPGQNLRLWVTVSDETAT